MMLLKALHEKHCFELVDQAEAEGRQIVDSTWVFKHNQCPDSLLKYKARLCIWPDYVFEGTRCMRGLTKEKLQKRPVGMHL